MAQPALKIVDEIHPAAAPKIVPQFLGEISTNARLTEIFVYSQRDFYAGSRAVENSRNFDPSAPLIPAYGENTLVQLGGAFTQEQVALAIKAQVKNEDPAITALREIIVDGVEEKKLYDIMVSTHEDAHRHGLVFFDKFISKDGIPLGVMAYEP